MAEETESNAPVSVEESISELNFSGIRSLKKHKNLY